MVTDLHRRHALAALAGLGACVIVPAPVFALADHAVQLAAAWERQGHYYIGLLSAREGAGQPLAVRAALEVPARAHGLAVLADCQHLHTTETDLETGASWIGVYDARTL